MPLASRKTPFKRSTRAPRATKKSTKSTKQASRLPPPDDYEDSQATEDENWIEDLREYLKNHLQRYLEVTHLNQARQDLLKSVVQGYRNQLGRNRFDKHSRTDAWRSILEIYNQHLRTKTVFDPNDDIDQPPTQVQPKRKQK